MVYYHIISKRAAQLTIDPVKHIELLVLKQLIKSCFSNQYKSQLEQPNIKPHNYQAVTYLVIQKVTL